MNRTGLYQTVSEVVLTPLFPDYKPEGEPLPLMTYAHISDVRKRVQKGNTRGRQDTWRLTIYAQSREEIDNLLNQLELLDNYTNSHFSKVYILSTGDRPETEGDEYLVTYIDIKTTNR